MFQVLSNFLEEARADLREAHAELRMAEHVQGVRERTMRGWKEDIN